MQAVAPYMYPAWVSFLRYAVKQPDSWQAFERETGTPQPRNMVVEPAEAKERGDDAVHRFAMWATLTSWGREGVPVEFMREAAATYPDLYEALDREDAPAA